LLRGQYKIVIVIIIISTILAARIVNLHILLSESIISNSVVTITLRQAENCHLRPQYQTVSCEKMVFSVSRRNGIYLAQKTSSVVSDFS